MPDYLQELSSLARGGNAAAAIFEVLRGFPLTGITRKQFHDLPVGA